MPNKSRPTDSQNPRSPYNGSPFGKSFDYVCSCGYRFVGSSSTCANCGGMAKSMGEVTRKTNDAPDLIKAGF